MIDDLIIIILNYNTANLTKELAMKLCQWGFHVIVVDNCSSDNSVKILSEAFLGRNVDFIPQSVNKGYAAGNNAGIQHALKSHEYKYIALMNPDIQIFNKNTIVNLCKALENDDDLAGITALTIFNNDIMSENPCASRLLSPIKLMISDLFLINKFVNRKYKNLYGNDELVAYVDKIQGCFFIMKTTEFEQIGFLDEHTFLYFEEDIIGAKIKNNGKKLGVLLSEIIRHNHGFKDSEMIDKKRRLFYNKCFLESKKYYMLEVLKVPYIMWWISYQLDSKTRKIKDILMK